jgi:hypothetical protein
LELRFALKVVVDECGAVFSMSGGRHFFYVLLDELVRKYKRFFYSVMLEGRI